MDCNTIEGVPTPYGWVYDGGNTPANERSLGPDMAPGNDTIYGLTDDCSTKMFATGQVIENVGYNNATFCQFIPGPNPAGEYCGTNGQGITHSGTTGNQTVCTLYAGG